MGLRLLVRWAAARWRAGVVPAAATVRVDEAAVVVCGLRRVDERLLGVRLGEDAVDCNDTVGCDGSVTLGADVTLGATGAGAPVEGLELAVVWGVDENDDAPGTGSGAGVAAFTEAAVSGAG